MKLNNRMSLIAGAACFLMLMCGVLPSARAQQDAGSITGLVTDSAGSAVAGGRVTARDVDRNTTWVTATNGAGLYEFPTIPVGKIEVKVEANGFDTAVRTPFTLILNQVARVDIQLKVGRVSTTVTVDDAPPLLQTGSMEVGTLIDSSAANTLPLATRDINQLTLLAPGVLSPNIFAFQSPQTTFGTGRPYVNGAREQDNNFILDGMDVNQPDNDDVAYTPAPDAVQEFNMIVSNAPADFGNYAGGVIVESIKSGTNAFHGGVYEYVRNTDLNANTWQDKANAFVTGYGPQTTLPRPVTQWNEFGGSVGGPIIRNKLFFFADEETSIYNQPRTANTNTLVPSSSFYTTATSVQTGQSEYDLGWFCTSTGGTFNAAGACSNGAGQLYMPAAGTATNARTAIPYDQIPVSAADPVAKALTALAPFQKELSTLNYFESGYTHNYQGDLKIDWQPTGSDHVMGRYTQMYTHLIQANGIDLLSPNLERQYPLKNVVADYVRTLTPTLINDFRIGSQIFPANDQVYTAATSGNINTQIGLKNVPVAVLPEINMGYGPSGYVGGSDGPEVFHDTTYQIGDALTWTHGRHSIHGGFEFLHYAMNDTYAGNNGAAGVWTFNGQFTGNGGGGLAYADFLLGLPYSVGVGEPIHFHLVNSLFGGYAQDNFQATHSLTLNLGLRYEVVTARGDRNKNNNVNFDLVTGTPEIGKNYNTYYGIGDLQPRVGFAWQPEFAPGTVVRGAYDISSYMEGNGISNMAVINPPNSILIDQTNSAGNNLLYPQYSLSDGYSPYQNACTAAELIAAGSTGTASPCLSGAVTHATDPNLRPAMNQQWNLTVQHQFKNNFTASLGYVGNKDDHMTDIFWYNQQVLTSATETVVDGSGTTVVVPKPAPGPYMQNLVAAGVGQARFNGSSAVSRFEAMEITVAQKSYHGLELQANYTWSKCLSNSLGYFGSFGDEEGLGEQQNEAGGNFFQNEYNPMGDYGRCTIDAASSFNAYGIYDLPFGKGKTFASGASTGLNELIGGWNVALDTTLRSGFAVTPYDGSGFGSLNPAAASRLTAPSYVGRADCVAGQAFGMPMHVEQIGSSIGVNNLNPAALSPQADGQFGNCPVGALRGPTLKTADFNLNKAFPITEGVNVTFMAQFINLTNTPIFSIPNTWDDSYSSCDYCTGKRTTGANGGGAGSVGVYGLMDGSNPGREIEFALKLNF